MKKYQVIVGNIGTVIDTDDKAEAYQTYHEYIGLSVSYGGRCSGESVALMTNDDIEAEYLGVVDKMVQS